MNELSPNEEAALDELVFELAAPHNLAAIAARLGLSAEWVRQIEQRALDKMRRAARRAEWTPTKVNDSTRLEGETHELSVRR